MSAMAPLPALIVEAFLNGLWQGTILAGLTWLPLRLIPCSARIRCAAWYACLAAVLCLPIANFATHLRAPASAAGEVRRVVPDLQPSAPAPGVDAGDSLPAPAILLPASAARWLIVGWAAISLVLVTRLALSYRNVAHLKSRSRPLDDPDIWPWAHLFATCHTRRRFEVRSSNEVRLPMLAGLAQPAILFPQSLFPLLSVGEKRRICLHELAHLRRRDDWANLFQKAAEAFLFFHPAIRWIGKRISLERELACDDWVVSVSGAVRPYAACLVRLAELVSLGSHPFPALGTVSNRKQIERRVEMLLHPKRNEKTVWSTGVLAGVCFACLAATAAAALMSPVIAVEKHPGLVASSATAAGPPPALQAAPAAQHKIPPQAEKAPDTDEHVKAAHEEISKLTEKIQKEVEVNVQARTDEIHKLAQQIQEQVQQSIQPQVHEITELAGKLAREEGASPRNEELIRKLHEQIKEHEAEIERVSEQEIKGLEQRIHQLEEQIRPSEEQIRNLETKIREIEKQMKEKSRKTSPAPSSPSPAPPR